MQTFGLTFINPVVADPISWFPYGSALLFYLGFWCCGSLSLMPAYGESPITKGSEEKTFLLIWLVLIHQKVKIFLYGSFTAGFQLVVMVV